MTDMKNERFNFLMNNSEQTIKHLLLKHSNVAGNDAYGESYDALLKLPAVLYWKQNIPSEVNNTTILGSSDSCFENSFGKLVSFGLSFEDILSHGDLKKYVAFLKTKESNNIYDSLCRFVVAGYLFAANFSDDIVYETVISRINTLYNFITTSSAKYNIYASAASFKIPSQYKTKKLVNPVLYEKNELVLPLVYDIFVFYYVYDKLPEDTKKKIDCILEYVSDNRYQSFDYGYGLIKSPQNKYHFMGWSVHLPLYNEALSIDYFKNGLIHRMVLLSRFKNPDIETWISGVLEKLRDFQIDDYLYCFSNEYLPEIKNSYFMNGRHTSLNENRRKKIGRIVESTFYIHLINDCN
ncbi:hypothetical protein D1164_03455 [Mariniphaga sediminis]|uniref:Uncharacterized protein n=1 Tax=Mariniphaga sediminis TaxID=1628158 RepID=A0A399D532_9BACT|nr:hypothetical protein [Mariniphaga sediminis]RIH66667.1 hypothetical protein D1164_03455 [Mariniphaga sediminis]